jgi:hypothetical protein
LDTDHYRFAGIHQVLADANGNIAAEFDFMDPAGTTDCPMLGDCVAYEVDLLNGITGAVTSSSKIHTQVGMTYALGTDLDLDNGLAVLGGAVDSQLTMFGFALAGAAQAYPESDRPTVGPAPTAPNISLSAPSPSDAILTRGLTLTATSGTGGIPIAKYQYAWAPVSASTKGPTTPLQTCKAGSKCRLSFAATKPSSAWTLFARAVDATNKSSSWASTTIQTPTAPALVALGDSITSGHHANSVTSLATCNDGAYGYPQAVFNKMEGDLPKQWRNSSRYYNFAYSGFTTSEVLGGGNGDDACGAHHSSPITAAQAALAANSNSWNQVVISAGVDDTQNWGGLLGSIASSYLLNPFYSSSQCTTALKGWGGYNSGVQSTIKSNVTSIATNLRTADEASALYWVGYYNVAGTGSPGLSPLGNPVVPATCANAFQAADSKLTNVIQSGLTGITYTWINTDSKLHMKNADLQSINALNIAGMQLKIKLLLSGWPHPNRLGSSTIALLFTKL